MNKREPWMGWLFNSPDDIVGFLQHRDATCVPDEEKMRLVAAFNAHHDLLKIAKRVTEDMGAPDYLRFAARKAIAKAEGRS